MLVNQDDVPVVSQRVVGQTQVTLTEVQLGHTLGLMFILPRQYGRPTRMVVTQPRGITDYVQRAKKGQDLKDFLMFTRGRTIHTTPIQSGATHAYFNLPNLGSAPATLILLLAGLREHINWELVDPEEMLAVKPRLRPKYGSSWMLCSCLNPRTLRTRLWLSNA